MTTSSGEDNLDDQRKMGFWEHLDELRQRSKTIILTVLVFFVVYIVTGVGDLTIGSASFPMLMPAIGATDENLATQFFIALKNFLIPASVAGVPLNFSYQQPWDAYVVMFKVAFFLAIVTASPVIAFEMGRFLAPGLRPSEKRLIARATVPVILLFLGGVALCFVVVLPFTFTLLFSVQNLMGANFLILYGDNFVDFVLLFSLAFGVAFELPVVMYGLSVLRIVSAAFWGRHWRIAIVGIFVFGALITPDGSGVTMMLVALPMIGLYVLGYAFSKRAERRRIMGAKSS